MKLNKLGGVIALVLAVGFMFVPNSEARDHRHYKGSHWNKHHHHKHYSHRKHYHHGHRHHGHYHRNVYRAQPYYVVPSNRNRVTFSFGW